MKHSDLFRQYLESCDVVGVRRLSAEVFPHLPQPKTDADVLAAIHHARTQMPTIGIRARAYSHRWLLDRGFPSGLPDGLKPNADRLYPQKQGVVGISVGSKWRVVRDAIQGAMQNAVLETYADGHAEQPDIVRARMMEARERERRGLGL